MQSFEPLVPGNFYHIYNKGINGENLFKSRENYPYFLGLLEKYIGPVAEIHAWCLLKNHFHFLLKIREIQNQRSSQQLEMNKWIDPSKAMSNLFNAYAKAINKVYGRTGGLFETPFKRKLVNSELYLKQLVFYIHNNPVKHGFCNSMVEYPWSSYLSILSVAEDDKTMNKTLGWFNKKGDFIKFHNNHHDPKEISEYIFDDD